MLHLLPCYTILHHATPCYTSPRHTLHNATFPYQGRPRAPRRLRPLRRRRAPADRGGRLRHRHVHLGRPAAQGRRAQRRPDRRAPPREVEGCSSSSSSRNCIEVGSSPGWVETDLLERDRLSCVSRCPDWALGLRSCVPLELCLMQ